MTLGSVGCFGEGTYIEQTAPVSGVLTFQDKPLEGYTVLFLPIGGNRAASGVTNAQGQFTLGTNDVGDGAAVGQHNIAITYVAQLQGEPGKEEVGQVVEPPVKLPEKYGDPATSGLTVEVPPEGLKDYKLDLES